MQTSKLVHVQNEYTGIVGLILSRYQRSCLEAEERITQEGSSKDITTKFSLPHGIDNLCTRFPTCKELLQSVERVIEKPNELPLTDMIELEEELNAALLHTRSREVNVTLTSLPHYFCLTIRSMTPLKSSNVFLPFSSHSHLYRGLMAAISARWESN
ncbi:hypothetical protein Tco_1245551 [Tanacetum coccineum]